MLYAVCNYRVWWWRPDLEFIEWFIAPNKVHLNVENVWVSNSIANNVDKLKYQSLVNMDGFGFMKLWWILMNNCTGYTFTSIYQIWIVYWYISITSWLQIYFEYQKCTLSTYVSVFYCWAKFYNVTFDKLNLSNNISNIDLSARYFWYKFPRKAFPPFPNCF